ncbi:MAG TPA: GNAT family N-acetyltransferase [Pseudonocardiaceae bacterium]
MSPTLRSARLLLDEYTPADEESFVTLFGDERVSRWMGDGPEPEAETRALFHRVFEVYGANRFDVWAVRLDGRHVGHAELKRTEQVDGHELIYALVPAVWRRGLGGEVARTVLAYGFGTLGLDAVHATVAPENTGSLALLAALGFRHTQDIPEDDGGVTRVLRVTAAEVAR